MLNLLMHFDALCPDTDCASEVHFRVASILDKLGGGSEEQIGKIFDFALALRSPCTIFGEDRQRLGRANWQILRLCLCSSLALHYLCIVLGGGGSQDDFATSDHRPLFFHCPLLHEILAYVKTLHIVHQLLPDGGSFFCTDSRHYRRQHPATGLHL